MWVDAVLSIGNAYRADLQALAILAVAAASFRWGAGPERASGTVLLYLLLADKIYHVAVTWMTGWDGSDLTHAAVIDASACFAMLLIGATANRKYPLWTGAFQLIAVFAHLFQEAMNAVSLLAYSIMYTAPSYFQIAILAAGIIRHHRRQRRVGTYKSWLISWNRLPVIRQFATRRH